MRSNIRIAVATDPGLDRMSFLSPARSGEHRCPETPRQTGRTVADPPPHRSAGPLPPSGRRAASRLAIRCPPRRLAAILGLVAVAPTAVVAQTDYYNTDAGRPVRVEDALPVERYAFEAQVAPLRMERADDGTYHWEMEPELAYGVLPGTQVEIGLHLDATDRAGRGRELGLRGVEIAALHNLNAETRTLPALGLAAGALLPVGRLAPDRVHPWMRGIATRTFRHFRVHLNGEYTFGPDQGVGGNASELSRWMVGAAIDRALPIQGALLIADAYVEAPLRDNADHEWTVEAGARYQLDPFFALDVGVGRRLNGADPGWFVTLGAARAFGIRSLVPVAR